MPKTCARSTQATSQHGEDGSGQEVPLLAEELLAIAGRGRIRIKGITSGRATIPQQNATNLRLPNQYKLYLMGLKMTKRRHKLWWVRKEEDLRGRS